jgi:hypothetical protein
MTVYRLLMACLSAGCLILAIGINAAALRGEAFYGITSGELFLVVLVVWGTMIIGLREVPGANRSFTGMRRAFDGAPLWMKVLAPAALVYAEINFRLATGMWLGRIRGDDPASERVTSGFLIAFAACALVVHYAAYRRAKWR